MPQFAQDEVTGLKHIFDEEQNRWIPFTDANSSVDAALIVAGGALNQIGRGVKNLLGVEGREELQAKQREQDQLLDPLRQARPVASFIGDALPGLATAAGVIGRGWGVLKFFGGVLGWVGFVVGDMFICVVGG